MTIVLSFRIDVAGCEGETHTSPENLIFIIGSG